MITVGFEVLKAVTAERFTSWDVTPGNPVEVHRHTAKQSRALLAACFLLVACFAYYSTMKMEAKRSSETPVNFCLTTWHYIPDDSILQD
jgi:hypothetical protein